MQAYTRVVQMLKSKNVPVKLSRTERELKELLQLVPTTSLATQDISLFPLLRDMAQTKKISDLS